MPTAVSDLKIWSEPPPSLFETSAEGLHDLLGGPSVIHVPGTLKPAVFISVLLHGNETSGWHALCQLINQQLAQRELIIFIGNVEAAAAGVRHLPHQPDYNRIWGNNIELPEARLASTLLSYVSQQPLFAAVDIHNNTGKNPHYGVLTSLSPTSINLAGLFADTAVLVEEPDTVLSRALEAYCPSITIESGPVGDPRSDERAFTFLVALTRAAMPADPVTAQFRLFRAIARVHIPQHTAFDFADAQLMDTTLRLTGGLEGVNFHQLEPGLEFGTVLKQEATLKDTIVVLDPDHSDVTEQYFELVDNRLTLTRSITPAMFTTDPEVVRQDCLCYFMTKLENGVE